MSDNPLRPYCPLCDKDYALEAFSSHVEFPLHIAAVAWAQRATVEHLTQIRALLQQLVDKSQPIPAGIPVPPKYLCPDCGFRCHTAHHSESHTRTTGHTAPVVRVDPPTD